ncbi:HIT finger domain-containing protein [Daldinia childiae]|uniref:HIT finger domain-containing protein n=1 Tax=Daldinia childiae TaxID=326645 RepID=UPI0014464266|nr:HIT finger domain-containing protein [Daldinia childiae]KAF3055595.1 HIT finger domain-containing protein [Daldinia childiae]
MNNFGVIELASTKTTNAPGWAYVPDTAPHLAAAAAASLQTGNRKRAARNQVTNTSAIYADADARQEAKLRREIEALDRDNYHRDVSIPIIAKSNSSKTTVKKHTPNVRKILQSQKTFANHLDDFEALLAQEKSNPTSAASAAAANSSNLGSSKKGGGGGGGGAAAEKHQQKNSKRSSKSNISRSASISKAAPAVKQEEDVEMSEAPQDNLPSSSSSSSLLTPYSRPGQPPTHPQDDDPLLVSRVPALPTEAELRTLVSAPPLNYAEARGRWTVADDGRKYPARVFCEVCGYWGRVRCMRCGVRVCALECLETHREECVSRYGL